jgi:hypothetical protein
MKKQQLYFVILTIIVITIFSGCDGLAELAHGPKPEESPVTYTVTFNRNGGSSVSTQTVNSGSTATRPKPNPTKPGYNFGGWYFRRLEHSS